MKLWLISQEVNNDYDTYSDAVVCAETKEEARNIHPSGCELVDDNYSWCSPKDVKVSYIGTAKEGTKKGVICASFHAG